jgi:mannose-6-phosphate isomerase-like protein (cupin superfamily)
MANYTVKNLKEVENSAEKFGMPEGMEARFAYGALEAEQTGISFQRLGPSMEQPFAHRHGEVEEIYIVLSGSGRLKLDGDDVDVKQWDAIRIAPQATRSVASGPDGIEYLAVGPLGRGDTEMLDAPWGS